MISSYFWLDVVGNGRACQYQVAPIWHFCKYPQDATAYFRNGGNKTKLFLLKFEDIYCRNSVKQERQCDVNVLVSDLRILFFLGPAPIRHTASYVSDRLRIFRKTSYLHK